MFELRNRTDLQHLKQKKYVLFLAFPRPARGRGGYLGYQWDAN